MSILPITIDILLSVVDNYGDMGFACELVISFEQAYPSEHHFRIFTDNVEKVGEFFLRNKHLLGKYEITSYNEFIPEGSSDILFALFHFPIPTFHDNTRRLILRFDYISFDPVWLAHNENEHIYSTEHTKVIEVIPSPIRWGCWLIHHHSPESTRETWLKQNNLSQDLASKKWVTMFMYDSTIEHIDFSGFPGDVCIFVFSEKYPIQKNIIVLQFLSLDAYYSLLKISDCNIVRGEVSFVQSLLSGKPFLWDMYKGKGWFPNEQSEQFLTYGNFSDIYKESHFIVNQQVEGKIIYQDINSLMKDPGIFSVYQEHKIKDLTRETKKHIDRFYFSL